MRELVFKNLTSGDKKRKDLYISETVDKNGIKTVTQRHSMYVIRDHNRFNNSNELMKWQKSTPMNHNRRHVFIYKKRDTRSKKESFICDVVGTFYAVLKTDVYSVAFKHSFEVDFLATKNK